MTGPGSPFAGRVALVTGAAGVGIGQACIRRFAAGGADVVVTDVHERRTAEVAAAVAEDFPDVRVLGLPLDAADGGAVQRVVAEVATTLGRPVDILVNNAAINVLGSVVDYGEDDWRRVIDVDLTACFLTTKAVLPGMLSVGRGSIVNISSVAGYLGGAGMEGPYAAAKAALHSLTRTVAGENGPHGIRCNGIAVGVVRTKFVEKHMDTLGHLVDQTPLRRMGTPEEIAAVAAWLASDESSFVTGETVNASGGWHMSP